MFPLSMKRTAWLFSDTTGSKSEDQGHDILQTILWLNPEAAMKSSHSQPAEVKADIIQWGDEKKWKISSGGVELNVEVSSLT